MKNFHTFLVGIFAFSLGFGQTTIFSEAGGGSEPTGWTFNNNITSNDIDRGSYWLVDAGSTSDEIITTSYDLSGYSSAEFSLNVASFGSGTYNQALIEISYDGGSTYTQSETSTTTTGSSYISGGTFSLNTLTASVVIKISNNGSSGRGVRLQNLVLTGENTSSTTQVQFTSASTSVSEGVGTTDLTFAITNPDGANATSFDVELTTGDNADINGYTTQTVTFPAGSSTNETVTITVTDDTVFEGDETLTFTITSVTGGNSAATGPQSTFELTIEENDASPSITIATEDFDGTSPKWNNDIEAQLFVDPSSPNEGLFIQAASTNNVNFSGNTVLGRDLEGENSEPSLSPYTFTFDDVDVSNYSSIVLSFDYHAYANAEIGNYEVVIDGTGQGSVQYFNDPDSFPGVDGTISIPVANGTSTVGLILTGTLNGGSDIIEFDNFKIEGVYNGYSYAGGSWHPAAPDGTTGASDAIIADGVAVLSSDVNLNDMVVNPGAGLEVATGTTLTVNTLALESTSTSYSSLILDGTITGTVTYNRYTNAYTNDATNNDNDLISTPLTPLNGEFFAAFATTNPNLLESGTLRAFAPFNNTTGLYENYDVVANASISLTPGTGYRAATSDGSTLAFIGTAETGDVYKDIIVGDDPTYGEWNLIGNPYPSYIDAEAFLTHIVSSTSSGETNMDLLVNASGIYGYDGDTSDGWKVITLANDNGQLIAPGQGFFVAADADDTLLHDVEFTPAMRTTGNADDFIQGRSNTTLSFVKLRASTANHSYNTEFYFDDNASLGLDPGYDAVVWGGTAPSTFALYSHLVQNNSGMPIALQALGSADLSNVTIPLGLNANAGESLTISISEMNTPVAVNVYLEDYQNNTLTLLNDTDFVINPIDNLNGTGRFYLRFSNSVLSTTDNVFDTVSLYANQANRTINISGQLTDDTFAKVYDIQGRLVSTTALDANATRQTIDASNLNTGVYIVKLTNNNITKTEKIILK
ncbi:T9SS type A sorting domain-containing protein [Winogradskyella marincola]|uniref:T9SS type A sorting domain-containing protein n=1 Tax=Winogradskyella marincola TaxID=3037795 RepID=A0ABT6FYK9_9FLAO|nr:T9SS type A sorting domain-containing protein [Winogradskyella sp. YYF002]MDG4714782.1 T9SS type A sorting domain-containing protein [Winogradskyella sp. YYF002]